MPSLGNAFASHWCFLTSDFYWVTSSHVANFLLGSVGTFSFEEVIYQILPLTLAGDLRATSDTCDTSQLPEKVSPRY